MGNYTENPFRFFATGLTSAKMIAEGTEVPNVAYSLNIDQKKMAPAYFDFLKATGYYDKGSGNGLSFADYLNGYTVFVCHFCSAG